MSLLKKIGFTLFFSAALAIGSYSLAADYGTEATRRATGGALPDRIAGVQVNDREAATKLVGAVISIILEAIGIVFFVLIFWSGFSWMTARGNSEKIEKAKDTILDAAIGLIVVMAAYAITNFVFDSLATSTGSNADPDAACHAIAGAECGTPESCTIERGTVRTGLCSGGAENVCCVPN